MVRATHRALVAGLILLPFSTAPGEASVVLAYGLLPLALAAGLYAGYRVMRPAATRAHLPALLAAAALVGGLAISTAISPTPVESVARFLPNVLGGVLFCYVLSPLYAAAVAPQSAYADLVRNIVRFGAILGAYFVTEFATAVAANGLPAVLLDRVTGGLSSLPWGASNVVASHLILPILLTFAPAEAGRVRSVVALAARTVMLAAVVVSQSRAALATILAGIACLALVLRGESRRGVLRFFAAVVLAFAVAEAVTHGALTAQVSSAASTRLGGEDVGDLNGRVGIWGAALAAFTHSPLLGVGYYAASRELGTSGHDILLTTLVERGVVGFVLSSAILVTAVASFVRAWRLAAGTRFHNALACLAVGGACSCFHLLFEDANFTQQYMVLSWLALALPELALRRARELDASNRVAAPALNTRVAI